MNATTLQPDHAFTFMLTTLTADGKTTECDEEHQHYFDRDAEQAAGT